VLLIYVCDDAPSTTVITLIITHHHPSSLPFSCHFL
jgi:hypothetical protein